MSKRSEISIILIISMIAVMLLSACAPKKPERKCVIPENEGVDTKIEITEYTKYDGEHSEMFLSKGDKVAVISPSSLPTREQTDVTLKGLKEWGYEPVEGKYACVKDRTLEDCMDDLTWALEAPEIKAVFCIRGGYAATEVADELVLDKLKEANKLIIGYSDITVYHAAMTVESLPSIHGLMSAAFSKEHGEDALVEQKMMTGEIPAYKCEANEYCKEGSAKGVLIGGNLSTFIACLGTDYDPTKIDEPYILFLEDVEEDVQHIHRCLTVLKHLGVLDNAAGIVFGEWTDLPDKEDSYTGDSRGGKFSSVSDMIDRQFARELDIPIAYGFPAGHGDVNYPLLMGEEAELSVSKDSFTLKW